MPRAQRRNQRLIVNRRAPPGIHHNNTHFSIFMRSAFNQCLVAAPPGILRERKSHTRQEKSHHRHDIWRPPRRRLQPGTISIMNAHIQTTRHSRQFTANPAHPHNTQVFPATPIPKWNVGVRPSIFRPAAAVRLRRRAEPPSTSGPKQARQWPLTTHSACCRLQSPALAQQQYRHVPDQH